MLTVTLTVSPVAVVPKRFNVTPATSILVLLLVSVAPLYTTSVSAALVRTIPFPGAVSEMPGSSLRASILKFCIPKADNALLSDVSPVFATALYAFTEFVTASSAILSLSVFSAKVYFDASSDDNPAPVTVASVIPFLTSSAIAALLSSVAIAASISVFFFSSISF